MNKRTNNKTMEMTSNFETFKIIYNNSSYLMWKEIKTKF